MYKICTWGPFNPLDVDEAKRNYSELGYSDISTEILPSGLVTVSSKKLSDTRILKDELLNMSKKEVSDLYEQIYSYPPKKYVPKTELVRQIDHYYSGIERALRIKP